MRGSSVSFEKQAAEGDESAINCEFTGRGRQPAVPCGASPHFFADLSDHPLTLTVARLGVGEFRGARRVTRAESWHLFQMPVGAVGHDAVVDFAELCLQPPEHVRLLSRDIVLLLRILRQVV